MVNIQLGKELAGAELSHFEESVWCLEAGPLSQWLFAGMKAAGLAVELLETRHVRAAFNAMPVKIDRTAARRTSIRSYV